MKILVTGAAGFLGSHLAESLAKMNHEVVGVDNMIGGYTDNVPKNIKFFKHDCCDLKKMNEVMNATVAKNEASKQLHINAKKQKSNHSNEQTIPQDGYVNMV